MVCPLWTNGCFKLFMVLIELNIHGISNTWHIKQFIGGKNTNIGLLSRPEATKLMYKFRKAKHFIHEMQVQSKFNRYLLRTSAETREEYSLNAGILNHEFAVYNNNNWQSISPLYLRHTSYCTRIFCCFFKVLQYVNCSLLTCTTA
jgi:hypothetical protein